MNLKTEGEELGARASGPHFSTSAGGTPVLPGWLAVAAIVVLGFVLRAAYYHSGYGHPDEAITVEVVGHMRQSGDWDTNWAKAPKLEAGLRYDQYNFSSHLYATFWFYRFVKLLPGVAAWRAADGGFWVYRFFSVVLASLVVWQTLRLGARVGGKTVALGAGALVAVATLLVQDAHFSRPEAFTTMLTLAVVALSWPGERLRAGPVLGAAFFTGLLIACKVSMLLLAWLPLVPLVAAWRGADHRWRVLGALPAALVVGFAVGAPGAVAHPAVFWHGVQHLMTQYAGLHPPHSHLQGGPVADMLAGYFAATLGWPALACFAMGMGALMERRRWAELVVLVGPVIIFAGYFSTRMVFFERNLSHVLPLCLIVSALGVARVAAALAGWWRTPVVLIATLLFALLLVRPAMLTGPLLWVEFSGRGAARHEEFERALRARHPGAGWKGTNLVNAGPLLELGAQFQTSPAPVLLGVTDYGDEWTAAMLAQFAADFDARPVTEEPGTFPSVPVSTLQTYHRARERYFLVMGPRKK